MDRFVTKTKVPPRSSPAPKPAPPVFVQTRIRDARHVVDLTRVREARDALLDPGADDISLLRALADAESLYIALEILEDTGIGRAVFKLSKHSNQEIATRSRILFEKWRVDALSAYQRRQRRLANDAAALRKGPRWGGAGAGAGSGAGAGAGAGAPGAGGPLRALDDAHDLDMYEVEELEAAAVAGAAARSAAPLRGGVVSKRLRIGESRVASASYTSPPLSGVLLSFASAGAGAGSSGVASAPAPALALKPSSSSGSTLTVSGLPPPRRLTPPLPPPPPPPPPSSLPLPSRMPPPPPPPPPPTTATVVSPRRERTLALTSSSSSSYLLSRTAPARLEIE